MTDTLLARHRLEDRVAGEHTAADLLRDAAAVAEALPALAADKPLALLGVRRDVYACVAALLGAWSRGYEVLIPPADCTRNGFLRLAQRADVGAVLHDTASSAALPIARILQEARPEQRLPDARCAFDGVMRFAAPEAHPHHTELRLEGSSLLREAVLVGHGLGLPTRGAYASLLGPCTRYAWALAVFWPLLSGGVLLPEPAPVRAGGWTEPGLGDASRARAVLIGAPSQLRLLMRREPGALARVERVVSVGVPLVAATRATRAMSDVYAHSQLGCIGYRSDEGAFQPLPEVSLTPAAEGLLVAAPHATGIIHAIPIAAGGFVATGVGAARAEQEEQLAWIDGVHDAAWLALPDGRMACALSLEPDVTEKQVRAACLELDVAEWRSLRRQPAAAAPTSFASGRCDLTRNPAGRHDRVSLLRLFGRDANATPLSFELPVLREEVSDTRCVRQVEVPSRYGYFEGHFPGYPLLPGAAQLSELVVPFVRSVRPELGRLTRMARLKFQERIVPNDVIDVCLELGPAGAVEFWLRRGESVCATGRLFFEAP